MGSGAMKSAGVWLLAFLANGFSVNGQSTIDPSSRLDCWPQPSPSQSACEARQCIWDTNYYPQKPTTPLCYYPQSTGYIIKSQSGNTAQLTKSPQSLKNPYDDDIDPLTFTYKQIGAGSHITIGTAKRYVPPVKLNTDANIKSKEQLSVALFNGSTFSFKVQRQSTGESIWDTSIGGLLFGDKYIQIATYLPTDRIFGFGENIHQELKHDLTKYTTWGMFARDQPPDSLDVNIQNLYGVHPFYLGIEEDGKAHGVFIFNSNAQEVTTGPAPHLIYRTIGGQLDIFFFPGPSPEDVIRQYQQVIGTPFLPAYWAFGFQLCRYGYKDLQEMKDTVKRIQDANIPFDIPYADIDYMERFKDFTINQEGWTDFPEYAKQLHDEGLHLFLIFDPAIEADYDSFRRALEQKAKFVEWPSENLVPQSIQGKYPLAKNTTVMLGVVWPDKHVGFPDFLDPSNVTNQWWISEFVNFHQTLPFDGIWIDMNEPSNFGTNMGNNPGYPSGHPFVQPLACPLSGSDSSLDVPPYQTISVYQWGGNSYLSSKTLCMLAKTVGGNEVFYNTKILYGLSESIATSEALYASTKKRGAVISRSTFPSSGHFTGHWLGDNTARWADLQTSIVGAQEFNMFGIPYVGADVCGFIGTTNEELCLRWQQLGSFHSFYRNHNTLGAPPQDPAQWPSVAKATRKANLWRYRHLPYLYTLHFHASRFGGTVVRPLFFEFPNDLAAPSLSHQFMWGAGIIVIPVIYPGITTIDGYLPVEASWYSLSDVQYGELFPSGRGTFYAPTDKHIPVFVRGGHVIPRQKPDNTVPATRKNEWQLLVALRQSSEKNPNTAEGELYWDDGDGTFDDIEQYDFSQFTYNFSTNKSLATLVITGKKLSKSLTFPKLGQIEILGYGNKPNLQQATLNGKPLQINTQQSSYSPFTHVLSVTPSTQIDLNSGGPTWTITWQNYF
jgi:alpha-glucosidase (family GH31 glycosyl hydrolase)